MKKIKILSAIMALAMMMTTFASCGQVDEENIDGDTTVATTTLGNVTTTVETDEVVLTTTSGSSTTTSNTTTTSKISTTTKKSSATTTTTTSKSSSTTTTTTRRNDDNWTTTNYSPDPEPQPQPTYTEPPHPTTTTTTTKKPETRPTTTTTQAPEPAKLYPKCIENASVETYSACIIEDLNNTRSTITDYKITVLSGNPDARVDYDTGRFRFTSFTAGKVKVELTWNFPENGIKDYKTTTIVEFYE